MSNLAYKEPKRQLLDFLKKKFQDLVPVAFPEVLLKNLIELADERVYLCSNKAVDTKELPLETKILLDRK